MSKTKCPKCLAAVGADSRFCPHCGTMIDAPGSQDVSGTRTIAASKDKLEPGLVIGGKYKILEAAGRGGMGIVYRAEDQKLKRAVALKFLPPEVTPEPQARNRFWREAQAAAALDHPNICPVYEVDEYEGRMFIAMAFLEGQNLKDRLAQAALVASEAAAIALQVAEGLRAAHEKGIIHRDIKPANIMLGPKGQARILDFGLARLAASDFTQTTTVVGTVSYMSPEQARGDPVDARTDIWSLGCMLYEMVAGRRPFEGERIETILNAILNRNPPPLTGLGKDVPPGLQDIIARCLQKNPGDRFPAMENLIEALRAAGPGESLPRAESVPSLAVLPFVDMSPGKDQDYFAEGIAEELIHALARLQGLRVVARTSAFALKGRNLDIREVGRILNVKAVLEGSVRKAGDRLRITVQLINVEDGYHLWSERFDREAIDIFAIQDEISLAVVEHLKAALHVHEESALRKRATRDPEAYDQYLMGIYFLARPNPESLQKALDFFHKALYRDPNFASAYAGLASVYAYMANFSFAPSAEVWPKAKAAIKKALSLDAGLAEAHALAATMALYYEWDWAAAEKSFQRALTLYPGDAFSHGTYAWFLLNRVRTDESLREIDTAIRLDPLMPLYYAWSVGLRVTAGLYDKALEEFAKAAEIAPDFGLSYFHAGLAYLRQGLLEKAEATFEEAGRRAVSPGWVECNLGVIQLAKGNRAGARQILEAMIERKKIADVSTVNIAWLAGALGDFDAAFHWLAKGIDERDVIIPFLHIYTPDYSAALARDPRYRDLLARLKLPSGR